MTIKKYFVNFIEQAEIDLYNLYCYIALNDSEAAADHLFNKIVSKCLKLDCLPERGNYPKELQRIGILEFRELNIKPYRIIYQLIDDSVFVHAILDGRRNLEDYILERFYSLQD